MKILCESDSPSSATGFGHVVRYLYHYFSHLQHDLIAVGWQNNCIPHFECAKCDQDRVMHGKYIDKCKDYWLVPVGPLGTPTPAMYTFPEHLTMYKPDLIFSLCDIHFVPFIPEHKKETPWMAYFPIDGDHWSDKWNPILDKCQHRVTYSKFAQKVCKKNGYDSTMIYHGCDPMVFKQYPEELVQKSIDMNFKPRNLNPNSFIVGTIQTCNPRKNWEAWLIAFAKFAEDKKDVVAQLITDPASPMAWNARIDLKRTIVTLGIQDKVWMPSNYHYWGGYSDKHMAELLNWMRHGCYFTVAGGEGFGLPQFQAMHCGVPVVALDYTTPSEFLTENRGYLVNIGSWHTPDDFERPLPDIDHAVEQLNKVYYNPEEAKRRAIKGMGWAKKYTWNQTLYKWAKLLKEIEEEL